MLGKMLEIGEDRTYRYATVRGHGQLSKSLQRHCGSFLYIPLVRHEGRAFGKIGIVYRLTGFSFMWASFIPSVLLPHLSFPLAPRAPEWDTTSYFLPHVKFLGVPDHKIIVGFNTFCPTKMLFCFSVALANSHFHCKQILLNTYFCCLVNALRKAHSTV